MVQVLNFGVMYNKYNADIGETLFLNHQGNSDAQWAGGYVSPRASLSLVVKQKTLSFCQE
jgi:hypothetical protein